MDALSVATYTYSATCILQLLLENSSGHMSAESAMGLLGERSQGDMPNTTSDHCAQPSTVLQIHDSADRQPAAAYAPSMTERLANIYLSTLLNRAFEYMRHGLQPLANTCCHTHTHTQS